MLKYFLSFFYYLQVACNCSNLSKQEVEHCYYNLSINGEKHQLDLSKFCVVKWLFFMPIKAFWSIVAQKDQTKTKVRKGLWEVIREKLMFRMIWNTLKDGLLLAKWNCIHENFLSEHARSTAFIRFGKAYTSFNLWRILNFFLRKYWPRLAWSSKCRWSVSHGDIKFWFSGSANTGRQCLLLQFHLSY